MASTLLAVDDSVTMRKVLEITFAGPEFRVVTATSPDDALQKLKSEKPAVVIADVTLEPKNGYDLCKSIKQAAPGTPVLILSSKQNPYDPAKGSAALADDHMDKPFDTQQMIDKVKKLLEAGGAKATTAPAAPAAVAKPAVQPVAQPAAAPAKPAPVPMAAAPANPMGAVNAGQPARAKTLIGTYSPPGTQSPPPAQVAPVVAPAPTAKETPFAPTPVSGVPMQQRGGAPTASPAGGAASHVNGQMASRLQDLGLSAPQIEAVLALSREVVERVVWEVVPVLAETIIKEEIARLTK